MGDWGDIEPALPTYARAIKRGCDVAFSVATLVILMPLMLVSGVAIWVSMGRPILFLQERAGMGGEAFTLIKFRTMAGSPNGQEWYRYDGERVTALGAHLRRASIDELPSLLNVLVGNMSLVGPRPLLTEYVARYSGAHRRRLSVKPGLTGLAQLQRQSIAFSRRFDLDIHYVDNWSLALDVRILLRTVVTVFSGAGVVTGQPVDDVDDLGLSDHLHSDRDEE